MEYTVNQIASFDRNARAYGWEVGRGQPLAFAVNASRKNPFTDPNWRHQIGHSKGGNMKNVFAFIAGGVVALAGVVLGSGVKVAAKEAQK